MDQWKRHRITETMRRLKPSCKGGKCIMQGPPELRYIINAIPRDEEFQSKVLWVIDLWGDLSKPLIAKDVETIKQIIQIISK